MLNQWWKEAVVYEIYFEYFNGSKYEVDSIISKLDNIKNMGITTIWINAKNFNIKSFTMGQSVKGVYTEVFRNLINEVHKKEMELIINFPGNRTSKEHPWFLESKKGIHNRYRDFYIWCQCDKEYYPNNWNNSYGESAWIYDDLSQEYYLSLALENEAELNWNNKLLRKEIQEEMNRWFNIGIDGINVDLYHIVGKIPLKPVEKNEKLKGFGDINSYILNGLDVHKYIWEINKNVLNNRNVLAMADFISIDSEICKLFTGNHREEFNVVYDRDLFNTNEQIEKYFYKTFNISDFKKKIYSLQQSIANNGWTALGVNFEIYYRMITGHIKDDNYKEKAFKAIETLLFTLKGTPFICPIDNIYGITITESIISYHKKMINLRKDNNTFIFGSYKQILNNYLEVLSFIRKDQNKEFLIIINLSNRNNIIDLYSHLGNLRADLILCNYSRINKLEEKEDIILNPFEAIVYQIKQ